MRASSLPQQGPTACRTYGIPIAAPVVLGCLFLLATTCLPVARCATVGWGENHAPDTLALGQPARAYDSLHQAPLAGEKLQLEADHTIIARDTTTAPQSPDSLSGTRWSRFCDSLATGWVGLSAVLLPGSGQVVNRDYWKIPIFYAAIGGFTAGAVIFGQRYQDLLHAPLPASYHDQLAHNDRIFSARLARNAMIAAAIVSYGLSVGDAVICHNKARQSPAAAAFCSALLPGLGQVYNRSYWKVPIIYGGLSILAYYWAWNNLQFQRADRALVALLDDDPTTIDEFAGKRSKEELQYFSDDYRRSRDLCLFGFIGVYILNIIDAYVDAHLFYWNVNNDISLSAAPSFTIPPLAPQTPIPGLAMNLFF